MNNFVVYVWYTELNNKVYIGCTHNLKSRINQYRSASSCKYTHKTHVINKAMRKYGFDNFINKVLHRFDNIDDMLICEQEMISLFDCIAPKGYNLTSGGEHPRHSNATKKKMQRLAPKMPVIDLITSIEYPSIMEAGRQLGVNKKSIKNWIDLRIFVKKKDYNPKIHTKERAIAIKNRPHSACKPVKDLATDIVYGSRKSAAIALKINIGTVTDRVREGLYKYIN